MLEIYKKSKWVPMHIKDLSIGDRYRDNEDKNPEHNMFCLEKPQKVGNYYLTQCTTIEDIKKELNNSGIKLKGLMFQLQ